MARNGTYYLGRVLKLGSLTQATLMQALSSPRPIQSQSKHEEFHPFAHDRGALFLCLSWKPEQELASA